jgi:pimeloyl-ACP methyl ester carboxylesterase
MSPTLVVVGAVDPLCNEAAEEIVAALPDHLVRFERFGDAGHHIHRDRPESFFKLLREFLATPATT